MSCRSMLQKLPVWAALLHFHAILGAVSSFSPSHKHNGVDGGPSQAAPASASASAPIQVDPAPQLQFHHDEPGLLPAVSRLCLEFSCTRSPLSSSSSPSSSSFHSDPSLALCRRDGINLYGREIVHTDDDARVATMSICSDANPTNDNSNSNTNCHDSTNLWEATLVLQPGTTPHDSCPAEADARSTVGLPFLSTVLRPDATASSCQRTGSFSSSSSSSSSCCCFVAMNRFHVKEDCKALFEERWSQRQSKLPDQPGFLGFSLLRRNRPTQSATNDRRKDALEKHVTREMDRFNYSTCTLWDSIESWQRWRNGGGKTSHDASRANGTTPKRVPVSEWLEGPSAPIFWDGQPRAIPFEPKEEFKDGIATRGYSAGEQLSP